jgi:hypothetical protein
LICHQDDHRLGGIPEFQFEYFAYSPWICSITTYTPNGICRVKDNSSPTEYFQTMQDILFKIQQWTFLVKIPNDSKLLLMFVLFVRATVCLQKNSADEPENTN